MPAREPAHVDVNTVTEVEVIRKTDFHIIYKVAGSDGLTPSFLKDGSEMITSQLTELMGSI